MSKLGQDRLFRRLVGLLALLAIVVAIIWRPWLASGGQPSSVESRVSRFAAAANRLLTLPQEFFAGETSISPPNGNEVRLNADGEIDFVEAPPSSFDSGDGDEGQNFQKQNEAIYLKYTGIREFRVLMSLVDDYNWQVVVQLEHNNGEFKLEIEGDDRGQYGDNDSDGIVDLDGSAIPLKEKGRYVISYSELSKQYSIDRQELDEHDAGGDPALDGSDSVAGLGVSATGSALPADNGIKGRKRSARSASDVFGASASAPGNKAPIARIRRPIKIAKGEAANFDASDSFDPDGAIVSYVWSNGLTGVTPALIYDDIGVYSVTLTVTDGNGATGMDRVDVEVEGKKNGFAASFDDVILVLDEGSGSTRRMALDVVADNLWFAKVDVEFENSSFHLDVGRNELKRYGYSNIPNTLVKGGGAVKVVQGPGLYNLFFHDIKHTYDLKLLQSKKSTYRYSHVDVRFPDGSRPISMAHVGNAIWETVMQRVADRNTTFILAGTVKNGGALELLGTTDNSTLVLNGPAIKLVGRTGRYKVAFSEISKVITFLPDGAGNSAPNVRLSSDASTIEVGQPVTLIANAVDPDGDKLSYRWVEDFTADDSKSCAFSPNENRQRIDVTFRSGGRHVVGVVVADEKGVCSVATIELTVSASPTAKAKVTPHEVFVDEVVTFDASESLDADGSTQSLTYAWGCIDEPRLSSNLSVMQYKFTSPGTKRVVLTVTNNSRRLSGRDENLVTVKQKGATFAIGGDFSGGRYESMVPSGNGIWRKQIDVGSARGFRFVRKTNSSEQLLGRSGRNGYAEPNGGIIYLDAAGTYEITFVESTYQYTATLLKASPSSNYDTMFVRTSFFNWAPMPMKLVNDHEWQVDAYIEANGALKFSASNESWNINWGDNWPQDGQLDLGGVGNNINVELASTYRITMRDDSKTYHMDALSPKQRVPAMYLGGAAWGWEKNFILMTNVADNIWITTQNFPNDKLEFKFSELSDRWQSSRSWGAGSQDGLLTPDGGNLRVPRGGRFEIRFNDVSYKYSIIPR